MYNQYLNAAEEPQACARSAMTDSDTLLTLALVWFLLDERSADVLPLLLLLAGLTRPSAPTVQPPHR